MSEEKRLSEAVVQAALERAEKAIPAEARKWLHFHTTGNTLYAWDPSKEHPFERGVGYWTFPGWHELAEFFAAATTDVPALARECQALRAERDEARAALGEQAQGEKP